MHDHLMPKIRHDFDRLALYDNEGWNHNNYYHSFLLKQLPSKGKIVLDIGCGTGEFSRLLAKRFDTVIAIDLSPKMIEVAKQRSQKYSNISFQVADVLQWKFPVEKFDAITSIATLHHLPVEKLLPTFQATLKPGGKLVILDLLAQENFQDNLTDLIAVPLNWLFLFKNRKIKQSAEAKAAMREHLLTDKFLTRSQVKNLYLNPLGKAKIRKHLFWRYSVIWQKPMA